MREVNIEGKTIKIEPFAAVPDHPMTGGRRKGPIRILCEELRDGESAFVPVPAKAVERTNLWGVGKAIGATLRYRREGDGVRIYRLPSKSNNVSVSSIKRAVGWS